MSVSRRLLANGVAEGVVRMGAMYREAFFDRASINDDERTVELSFSSEGAVVPRWYGGERLGHGAGECDMGTLAAGRAPLLVNHNNREDPAGVVSRAWIDPATKKGRAVVRFGRSARASEIFADVKDGIRSNVSCGYAVNRMQLESQDGDEEVYRVTSWRPFEISLVSVPADETVGVGRAADETQQQFDAFISRKGARGMSEKTTTTGAEAGTTAGAAAIAAAIATPATPATVADRAMGSAADPAAIAAQAVQNERERASDIRQLGVLVNMRDKADEAIRKGLSFAQFKSDVYNARSTEERPLGPLPADIGLSDKEQRAFSLFKLVRAITPGATPAMVAEAGLELAASQAVRAKLGKDARGAFVPADVLGKNFLGRPFGVDIRQALGRVNDPRVRQVLERAITGLSFGTTTAGGFLVGTDHHPEAFIELLRAHAMVMTLGAKAMSGLVGNIDIPKQTGAATASWLSAEGANVAESNSAWGQLLMSPKTIAARTDMTRRLVNQASPSVEALVRADLLAILGLAVDAAAINGTGSSGQPQGVLNASGVAITVLGTNGLAPTWASIVDQETQVAVANADQGNLAYLTTIKARGKLKTTDKSTGGFGNFLWTEENTLNGYPAYASNQVPSNLVKGTSGAVCSASIFGNWGDIIIGEWGVLDLQVDRITLGDQGGLVLRAFQDVDVGVRRGLSFDAILDMLTT